MTIPLLVAVLAAAIAVLRGGSLDRLAATHFRWVPLLFVALALQLGGVIWDPPWLSEAGALAVVLGSMVGVAIFLTVNRHLAGTLLAAVGLSLNVLVIGLNGAMPVSQEAARAARVSPDDIGGIKHEVMTEATQLRWLGDVIPIPRWTVISIGDVVLGVGLARLTYRQTRHGELPGAPRRRGATRPAERGGDSAPGAPPAPPPSPHRHG